MTRRARIGVVGAGWWATANHLPVLAANPDCEVVAVNRLGAAELEQVRTTFAVPHAFEDYRAMLDTVPMDGVVIASPHGLHREHALAALARGCHVLVEKPLATSSRDAWAIVEAGRRADRAVVIPYGWNFKPWTEQARALVAAGAVGRIEHVTLAMASPLADLFAGQPMRETEGLAFRPPASTWADPAAAGGYGWGQLVHALGLLFRIADLEPEQVTAMTGLSPVRVDYFDAAAIRFRNGATASVSGAATVPKHRGFQLDLRMFGSEGMLLLDIERPRLEVRRHDGADTVLTLTEQDTAYACSAPLDVLVDLCLGRPALNAAPGEVGARAIDVLDALYRSGVSGRMETA